jgi:uncharacterized membrane protein affecting hemolysin expression
MDMRSRGRSACLVALILLALLAIGLFVWRMVDARQAEQRLAAQKAALAQQSEQDVQARTNELLRLLAAPIAWAVHGPLARKELGPINGLFNELARDPNLREVMLIDNQGQVLAATNKARLGAPLADDIPAQGLEVNAPTVLPHTAGTAFLFVPIMEPNSRLGTVVIYYQSAPVSAPTPATPPSGGGESKEVG